MLEADQRRLLGAFVRAHRERMRPTTATGRRRTPGLKREELAASAGISVTWCAWIEQGRPVQASPEALGRIAQTLALSRAERDYLFKLAGRVDPQGSRGLSADAPPSLIAAVKATQCPAYGLDRLWNACCWNEAAARLFRGWLELWPVIASRHHGPADERPTDLYLCTGALGASIRFCRESGARSHWRLLQRAASCSSAVPASAKYWRPRTAQSRMIVAASPGLSQHATSEGRRRPPTAGASILST